MSEKRPTWLQHALRQASARTQAETVAIAGLVIFVSIIIGALYLAQATTTATTGFELEQLVKTRDSFQRNNEDMNAQIARKKQITDLRKRSEDLGFQPIAPEDQEYIVIPGYMPNRATPTSEASPVPTYVYDETFNGWVQQQWDKLAKQFDAWAGKTRPTPVPVP